MLDSFAIDATTDSSAADPYILALTTQPVSRATNDNSARTPEDQATLSPTAQAKIWQGEGLSVAEIADELGLSVSAIQQDLGIAAAAISSQTYAASA